MGLIYDIRHDVSNRRKHFLGGMLGGLLLTVFFVAGVASGMEYKDSKTGGKWDWKDWAATMLGGIAGGLMQTFLIAWLI